MHPQLLAEAWRCGCNRLFWVENARVIVNKVAGPAPEVDPSGADEPLRRVAPSAGVWVVGKGAEERDRDRDVLENGDENNRPCSLMHATSVAGSPRNPGTVEEGI